MIEIHDVTKKYGRREALAHVTVQVRTGEITLLLGANGAGKSTLLRCLLGVTDFDGEIRVRGLDPRADGPSVRALIGYMPQTGGLHLESTVDETLQFYADIRRVPRERCAALLAEAGLTDHSSTRVGELSGGMRQRLGFAIALLTNPSVLVLDEPSASLDARSREWLADRLRACADAGCAVLVSTHAGQELLDAGDRRMTLEDGRLISNECTTRDHQSRRNDGPDARIEIRAARRSHVAPRASILPVIRKELRDAIGNRWVIGYTALSAVLGLAATATGLGSTSGLGLQAFGRTTATLMNMCLLLSPLVAVLMGAATIAGEQDRGTLDHLLAQPFTRTALLLGKHVGLLIALTVATAAGFLPAGLLIVSIAGAGVIGHYLLFPAIASLAAAAMCGIGIWISVSSRTAIQAQGAGIFTWFAFVLLYDLLLVGTLATSGLPAEWLAVSLVANPIDAARVLGVLALEPDLYLLGPAGTYLTSRLSHGGAAALLLCALLAWSTGPVLIARARFALPRRSVRQPTGTAVPGPAVNSITEVTSS
jgi:ABC-type multidrug transport system ATPase subunit/ABC-type transport system involved in multi-copper enzyme maturation permease subunit